MDQWKVVLHNHLPAYISFERYLGNMERLRQNCSSPNANGAPARAPQFARFGRLRPVWYSAAS